MRLSLIAAIGFGLVCGQANAATNPKPNQSPATSQSSSVAAASASQLSTAQQKISYAIGFDMGQNFKMQNIVIDPTIFAQGMKDALSGANTLMSEKEMQETLVAFQRDILAKRAAEADALKTKNKQEGDNFLAANKSKQGVFALPDGLQYKVITAGKGVQPTEKDIVTVNYSGTSIDGKEFDSSYKHGKAVTFPLADMIPGWIEALKLMKSGSTWEIYVPPTLAYGERGAPPNIGPNQTLIFKVNLVDVKKQG